MLKTLSTAALLALAGAAFAQSTPPHASVTPFASPSDHAFPNARGDAVANAGVTPPPRSNACVAHRLSHPVAVGGLSRCENMIGLDRDSCMQQERAGTGSTAPRSSSGSSTSGTSTQPTAPIGSPTGTVR